MRRLLCCSIAVIMLGALVGVWSWQGHAADVKAADGQGAAAQANAVEITAQVLLRRKLAAAVPGDLREMTPAGEEDWLASQQLVIRSWAIASKTASGQKLQELRSFKDRDQAFITNAITNGLSVRRPLGRGNVFDLSFRWPDVSEGQAIVDGVIGSYRNFLENTNKSERDKLLEVAVTAQQQIQKRYADHEEAYRAFLQRQGPADRGADEIKAVLTAAASKRAALLIAQKELEGRLTWLEKAASDPQSRTSAQLKANEWATRSGFDKLSDSFKQEKDMIQAYRQALKQDLEENASVEGALTQLLDSERHALGTAELHAGFGKSVNSELARLRNLRDRLSNQADEMTLIGSSGGYDALALSPPAAKTAR